MDKHIKYLINSLLSLLAFNLKKNISYLTDERHYKNDFHRNSLQYQIQLLRGISMLYFTCHFEH